MDCVCVVANGAKNKRNDKKWCFDGRHLWSNTYHYTNTQAHMHVYWFAYLYMCKNPSRATHAHTQIRMLQPIQFTIQFKTSTIKRLVSRSKIDLGCSEREVPKSSTSHKWAFDHHIALSRELSTFTPASCFTHYQYCVVTVVVPADCSLFHVHTLEEHIQNVQCSKIIRLLMMSWKQMQRTEWCATTFISDLKSENIRRSKGERESEKE